LRIFLDVGSHEGQTIDTVLNPVFKIDLIYGFDPSPTCYKVLIEKFEGNNKIVVFNLGLWNETRTMILHNESTQGATIYSDYESAWRGFGEETMCSFVKTSDWFKNNLLGNDEVFLKLNCEGCECDIVNDLLDSGEFSKLKAVLIDYDVRKSASQRHKEGELKKRLISLNITNVYPYMDPHRARVLKEVLG
jgi:FkbM family methyltransferase